MIPLQLLSIEDSDINQVCKVLRSGLLVQGEQVLKLEKTIANFIGVKEAVALSNGTATLHMALLALGIGKGDEVIVPAFSYIATANVVEIVGATPVFVDINASTFNIDVSKVEEAITDKTKAIIPVHEFGLACDISEISELASKYSLKIIEDAACALGAKENNKMVGSFGDIGSFSFHPRKAITSGEGGIITTSSTQLADKIRILRNHGISIENGNMEFVEAGFNYRMTDFQGAMLNSQYERLEKQVDRKNDIASYYFERIINKNIILPEVPENKNHTWQTFHVVLDEGINRNEVIDYLKAKNIGTNYGAQCIPVQKYFQKKYQLNCDVLYPNSMRAYKQGLAIPIYEKLTKDNVSYIVEQLNKI